MQEPQDTPNDEHRYLAHPGLFYVTLALLVVGICWAMLMQIR